LLTFALFAYKQERFIQKAIEGAFSQTYSPFEIILSDDCSHDRTFGIMRDAAANYGGPHKVVLNCNPKNVGLAEHVNRVVGLASPASARRPLQIGERPPPAWKADALEAGAAGAPAYAKATPKAFASRRRSKAGRWVLYIYVTRGTIQIKTTTEA
jgi:hypothetical protein